MDGSRRTPRGGRRRRAALLPALVVVILAVAAPAASPDPGNGKGNAGAKRADVLPPGQQKKADAVALDQARAAADVLVAAAATVAAADTSPGNAKKARKAKPAARSTAKPGNGSAASARSAGSSPASANGARAADTAKGNKSSEPAGDGGSATAAPPAPATTAVSTPAPVAVSPTAPVTQLAAVAPVRATAARTRLSQTATSPRARRTPSTAPAPVVLPDRPASIPALTAARAGDGESSAPPKDASASPLTRTVVRVLEVVPPAVWIALAGLALLGLLLGATTALQTVRGRRLERQRQILLADVGLLQSALLPDLPAQIGGAKVSAAYRPADGLAAGGDFYDAFDLPGGRTAVLVGDVAGHGRDAVPLTALVRYNLRAYLEAGLSPRATLHIASNVLSPQLSGRQVTIVVAIFDPGSGRLTYACAGHWPPLLLGLGSAEPVTVCSSPPIGAGVPTGRRQTTVALEPGARACFLTDGLGEALIAERRRLGRDGVIAELEAIGPDGDAEDLIARVVRRSTQQPDDMAACILTALPGGAEHWPMRIEELEVDVASLRDGWAERFLVACGVGSPHIVKALRQARDTIGVAGTAILEVRIGEELVEVRVGEPAAVLLPIGRRETARPDLARTA